MKSSNRGNNVKIILKYANRYQRFFLTSFNTESTLSNKYCEHRNQNETEVKKVSKQIDNKNMPRADKIKFQNATKMLGAN